MSQKARRSLYAFFIILCIAIICGGVYMLVNNTKIKPDTVTQESTTAETKPQEVLIGSSKEDDFSLYFYDGKLIMEHKGLRETFDWSVSASPDTIQFGTGDFDGDSVKEAVVILSQTDKLNELHILKPLVNGSNLDFNDAKFTVDSVNFNAQAEKGFNAVQLENLKRVKFTFGNQDFYFRAVSNSDGTYQKFQQLSLTGCNYKLQDGKISVTVALGATFEGKEPIEIGTITSELVYDKTQYIFKNPAFKANAEYSVNPPVANVKSFEYTFINNNVKTDTGLALSDIEFTLDFSSLNRNFDTGTSEEKYLSYITVTEKYIKLAVSKRMSFDRLAAEPSVMTILVGGENGFFVQGKTEVKDGGDYYYLVTYFDEPVSKEQMTSLTYKFKV